MAMCLVQLTVYLYLSIGKNACVVVCGGDGGEGQRQQTGEAR